jgi:hypothetical protein
MSRPAIQLPQIGLEGIQFDKSDRIVAKVHELEEKGLMINYKWAILQRQVKRRPTTLGLMVMNCMVVIRPKLRRCAGLPFLTAKITVHRLQAFTQLEVQEP